MESPVNVITDQIGKHPVLPDPVVKELIERYQVHGDLTAKETAVLHNLGLAVFGAKSSYRMAKAQGARVDFADVLQEAIIALSRAVETHDLEKAREVNAKFSTWAMIHIRGHTQRFVDNHNMIRIPVHIQAEIRKLSKRENEIIATEGRTPHMIDLFVEPEPSPEPTSELLAIAHEEKREPDPFERRYSERQIGLAKLEIERLAQASDCFPEDVEHLLTAKTRRRVLRLDWLPEDSEVLVDEANPNPLAIILRTDQKDLVARSMDDELDYRQRRVLELRYGINKDRESTFDEIGTRFHVTRERIRQIELASLRILANGKTGHLLLSNVHGDVTDHVNSAPGKLLTPPRDPAVGKAFTNKGDPVRGAFLVRQQRERKERDVRRTRYANQAKAKRAQARADRQRMEQGDTHSKRLESM